MRTRNKKWRHVYPYTCKGCSKKRVAYSYERAQNKLCRVCEPSEHISPDQAQLFHPAKQRDGSPFAVVK